MSMYSGTIVEESLLDNRFINQLDVRAVRISSVDNPADRWHLYKVAMSETQIAALSEQLKPEKWYAHFWDDTDIWVVFPNKTFKISRHDTSSWESAVQHGLSLSIPREQLDFLIEE